MKSLLLALTHSLFPDIHADVLRAAREPNPTASLKSDALRSYVRDLARIGIDAQAAHFIAQRVIGSLKMVLDDRAVPLDDKAAVLLATERATLAAVSAMIAIWAAESAQDVANDPDPSD